MRRHLGAALLLVACARPTGAPLEPVAANGAELVTIASFDRDELLSPILGAPLEQGRHYAVVDGLGFVGTLRAKGPWEIACILACIGCCGPPRWVAVWTERPSRPLVGHAFAIGPVDGRLGSARRELPATDDPLGHRLTWEFVRDDRATVTTTLVRFTFAGEPSVLEGRGLRVDGKEAFEIRVREHGTYRVIWRGGPVPGPALTLD